MSNAPIAEAINDLTAHIRKFSKQTVWDYTRMPSEEEERKRESEVLAICDQLDALARSADADETTLSDFDQLRNELSKLGAYATDDQVMAVARAYNEAGRLDAKR